ATRWVGNLPWFLLLIWVRLAGFSVSRLAYGPLPLPSTPWQPVQYLVKMSFPFGVANFCCASAAAGRKAITAETVNVSRELTERKRLACMIILLSSQP